MKKTLVLGASTKVDRYSNIAIARLLKYNHEVVALGGREDETHGIKIHKGAPDFKGIDTITLYLNPKRQEQYYQYIQDLNPQRVIFNPGTENPELYEILEENGIDYEVACTLVLLGTNQY